MPRNQSGSLYDWQSERDALATLAQFREIPAEQFPGHKAIACANLEGFIGGRFPALLAQRDELVAALEAADKALMEARNGLDLGLGCANDLQPADDPRRERRTWLERHLNGARAAHRAVRVALEAER